MQRSLVDTNKRAKTAMRRMLRGTIQAQGRKSSRSLEVSKAFLYSIWNPQQEIIWANGHKEQPGVDQGEGYEHH